MNTFPRLYKRDQKAQQVAPLPSPLLTLFTPLTNNNSRCPLTLPFSFVSNFFAFFPNEDGKPGGTLVTPPLDKYTILAGCTRDSILTLARNELGSIGVKVEERPVSLKELAKCKEAFCCGTGASITPVGSVAYRETATDASCETVYRFGDSGRAGEMTNKLYKMLYDIQYGTDKKLEKKYADWIMVVPPVVKEKTV